MKLKPLVVILIAFTILGCVQEAYKPSPVSEKVTPIPTTPTSLQIPMSTKQTPMPTPTQAQTSMTPSMQTPIPAPTQTPAQLTFEFGKRYEAKVIQVIDGDTIDVQIDENIYRIRLLGVDCPETTPERNKPYEYDEITDLNYLAEWGLKAKEFAQKILDHDLVYIEFDRLAGLKGYYGRYLAYVYLKNGTDFNALLLKNGFARVYTGTFEKEEEYLELENYAKTHKIGLWAYITPTPTPASITYSVKIAYINYDAPGNDWYNPNGEYVVIKNYGSNPVNLKDWKLKDKAGHTFVFPDVTLQPGESVYVHSGKGANAGNKLYWGDGAIWNNDGDTAYLYDSSGRLVDTYMY